MKLSVNRHLIPSKRRVSLANKVVIHGLWGAVAGYFLLHPASMLIHSVFEQGNAIGWDSLMLSFSLQHLAMAIYFTIVGTLFGVVYGFYAQTLARLYEEVKVLSLTDDLTSLYNRRFFYNRLKEETERARRYTRALCLLMIDIDNFKHYNDSYGHQQGDKLLRLFARRLRNSIRENDFVARLGGEEFAVIMPEAAYDKARKLAERFRQSITTYPLSTTNGKVTISIGIAGLPFDAQDADGLIYKADRALYQAKRAGKNRVCIYDIYDKISVDSKVLKDRS